MTVHEDYMADDMLQFREQLQQWFRSELGRNVLLAERQRVDKVLPNLFGYHILQLGHYGVDNLLESSRISHKVITCSAFDKQVNGITSLSCASHSIPIASDSMDVVVLPHSLEFESKPHQVLRETERVLIGEGHVLILGFNPRSLWGLRRFTLAWREKPPWTGHYLALTRLKDWLQLLGFEIVMTERFYFRPPISNPRISEKLKFMEQLGRYCWPYLGGVYMLLAKKRVIPLTPVKMRWQARRRLIASGVAEPSARIMEVDERG